MSLPEAAETRLFYRAADQRFDDARVLIEARRTTGAVYLAGYAVECILKALILASVARKMATTLRQTFKGNLAHDIGWLQNVYRRHTSGGPIPREMTRHLARVASWSTHLRYIPGTVDRATADDFVDSVAVILGWAKGRM